MEQAVFGWTMPLVQSALEALDAGDLGEGSRLGRAMERDPIIKHGLGLRVRQLLRAPFEWTCPDGLDQEAFDAFVSWWKANFTADHLASVTKHRILLGVSPAQLTWHPFKNWWMPRCHPFDSGTLSWRESDRRYVFIARDGVHTFDSDGHDERGGKSWQLFRDLGVLQPWREGITLPLAVFWLLSSQAWRYWATYNKTREPFRKVSVPAAQRESDDLKELVRRAQLMIGGQVVTTPKYPDGQPSYDFDLLEAKASTWQTYPEFCAQSDDYKTLLLLGATDNTRGGPDGSRARADVHEAQTNKYLGADGLVTTSALSDIARAWCRYNRIAEELAPVPCFQTEPPEDASAAADTRKTNSESLKAASEAINALGMANQVDRRKLLEMHGIPLLSGAGADPAPGLPDSPAPAPPPISPAAEVK